ncbi:Hypothetical protein PHPALM_16929 [Phytophthora palmivora]|uniref:Uncharacterized protein n=1 Tax=Phytophthora palmivora TaxID=4796 RepID=A0A2P4XNJ3_9STRA|nr:Hypothetical protein PHPALM_16929 [Phytophthora palmivora]
MARVADRLPLLLPLATSDNTLCVVVKIRPTLLHFLRDKRVWAVIRSKVPITDIADYGKDHSETRYKILVSGVDGNVWVVTMPDRFHPGVITRELLLERSSIGSNDGAVQWFCQQPGVQSVDFTPAGSGLTSLTLMRSVVTPTTLIVSSRGNSESKLQRHQSLELDKIEGEQSTCTLCLSSQVERHSGLLKSLFPDVVNYTRVVAILVGDLDGYVRFSLVQCSSMNGDAAKTSVVRNGTLLQLGEPVQIIVPFTCSEPSIPSLKGHEPTLSSPVFDALLVVGTRGRLGVVELKNGILRETLPVPVSKLEIGCAVQSLVYANSLGAFVFCSSGSAFVFKRTDLLAKAHPTDSEAKIPFINDNSISAEKLPLQPGILRVATQGDASDHNCQ